ncbi:MAG: hypothetical protein J6O04_01470 [Selenomonadaceae bacterium]|nr:hypothetical protein [Selenomonadaceae bacterium]
MSEYLKLYGGTVTSGGTDGTAISEDMAQTNPVSASLNAKNAETKAIKLALRCTSGFQTYGNTTVKAYYYNGKAYVDTGGNIGKFSFAADNGYSDGADAIANATWTSSLTISDVIGSTNQVFWVKIASDATQIPQKDTTVSIHVEGVVEAV